MCRDKTGTCDNRFYAKHPQVEFSLIAAAKKWGRPAPSKGRQCGLTDIRRLTDTIPIKMKYGVWHAIVKHAEFRLILIGEM
jgi:hypothetical protein